MADQYVHVQGRDVPFMAGKGIDKKWLLEVQSFGPFEAWVVKMEKVTEYLVEEVSLLHIEHYENRVAGCKVHTSIVNEKGLTVQSSMVLRGNAAVCLIALHCEGEEHVVVAEQYRPTIGEVVTELPGGMLDSSGNFRGHAADILSMRLPTTVHLNKQYTEDLLHLIHGAAQPMLSHTVPKCCDEGTRMILFRKKVNPSELAQISESLTCAVSPMDCPIAFKLVPLTAALAQYQDARLLSACYLLKKVLSVGDPYTAK